MRLAVVALLLAPLPLLAQPSPTQGADSARVTVSVIGVYRASSTLFGQDVTAPASGGFQASGHTTRLRLDGAWMPGMRVEYRVRSGWRLYGEGASGNAAYRYLSRWWVGEPTSPSGVSENATWGPASVWSASAGVAHAVTPRWRGARVELEAGATFQRNRLPYDRGCVRTDASMWCPPVNDGLAVRWDPVVDVPGARGGVAVRQRVLRRLELQARFGYTVGRVHTETFWAGVDPAEDAGTTGQSYWVRTRQASGGVSLHF
jgi:hypothetical protein